jgi:glycosyltransferase involved in cell wall biosynthesis
MKVGFHSLIAKGGHQGRGIGFYAENLLAHLKRVPDLDIREFSELDELKDADVVHYPTVDFFKRSLPLRKKFPTVVTIHDITPLLFPKHYPPGIRGRINLQFQKKALKSVKRIITDSENSKSDIHKYFKFTLDDIKVVYLAPSDQYQEISDKGKLRQIQNKYSLPEKFALFTGNVNWNKNILNQAAACLETDLDLVLVGKSFETKDDLSHPELRDFKEFLTKYADNPKIHILGFVNTEDLISLYNLAEISLLVSFYEGFGLTILEAQSCGCPVITSNVSSMPEVAGDGAVLVNPGSVSEIKEAIKLLLEDQDFKRVLIKKGFENVKRFNWEKTAQETVKVYKDALS